MEDQSRQLKMWTLLFIDQFSLEGERSVPLQLKAGGSHASRGKSQPVPLG